MTTKTNGCGAMGCDGGRVLLSHSWVPCLECQPAEDADAAARPRGLQSGIAMELNDLMSRVDDAARVMATQATEELPPGWKQGRGEVYRPLYLAQDAAGAWEVYRREHADKPSPEIADVKRGIASLRELERLSAYAGFRARVEADRQAEVDTRHTYGPGEALTVEPTIGTGDYVELMFLGEACRGTVMVIDVPGEDDGVTEVDCGEHGIIDEHTSALRLLRKAGDIRRGDIVRDAVGDNRKVTRVEDGQVFTSGRCPRGLLLWAKSAMTQCTLLQLAPSTDSAKVDT